MHDTFFGKRDGGDFAAMGFGISDPEYLALVARDLAILRPPVRCGYLVAPRIVTRHLDEIRNGLCDGR